MILEKLDKDFFYHFFNGTLTNAYDYFGAHLKKRDNEIIGCEFLVYAPNAKEVMIIGEFNNFIESSLIEIKEGFFYIYIKDCTEYQEYKYVLTTKENERLYKSDPYAFYAALRPNNNSKIYDVFGYKFNKYKRKSFKNKPIIIYEMHIGSWKKSDTFLNYNELVDDLIDYLLFNKYTHVEFLPLSEHPLDDSWGYMATGYFAPTSRYGTPKDLMYLIDKLHQSNIKIILDWVPGHICRDDFGLYKFDGTYLYEYDDEIKRENVSWGTANLDLSKNITKSFLISNALFWVKHYQIDGFRLDAVSNLIYYLGKKENGINNDSILFLKLLNNEIKKYDKNIMICAEDSSDYPNVTKDTKEGLGFDYKWNMGWMNDTLTYFKLDPLYRKYHHNLITFSFTYCYNESYILPISHDEVVHLKKSLINKMFGCEYDKFASLRLFFGYMFTHPGKKLLFMGQEFAQYKEWDFKSNLDFYLFENKINNQLNLFLRDTINLYLKEKSLNKTDNSQESFYFIEPNNNNQSVFIYSRIYKQEHVIVILNALPIAYDNYKIGVFGNYHYKEVLNSDNKKYGGSGHINNKIIVKKETIHNMDYSVDIKLGSLSVIVLKAKVM